MKQNWWKLLVVVVLVVAVGAVLAGKPRNSGEEPAVVAESTLASPAAEQVEEPAHMEASGDPSKVSAESAEVEEVKPEVRVAAAPKVEEPKPAAVAERPKSTAKALPKMIELGADQCIPCRMMKPILEELERDYKGKLEIEYIDVWKDRAAGEKYRVQSIPTQVFIDENGEEFFRHVGFFPKEDILKTFRNQGIKLD